MDGIIILIIQVRNNPHEIIQSYLEKIYDGHAEQIKKTLCFRGNEIYGEILYYSAIKLIKHLAITSDDHFLDVGSGLGKLALYIYLNTPAASVTGIEINQPRHEIADHIKNTLTSQLPLLFEKKPIQFIHGDFLKWNCDKTTIVYMCSTIFSYELLENIGKKLNTMRTVKKIASFRKIPHLSQYKLIKKLLIHCSWERVSCYLYERVN